MNADYVRLTGTVKRKVPYHIAIINELPLATQEDDREQAVEEVSRALRAYLVTNEILGQVYSVMERTGHSGELDEREYFERLMKAIDGNRRRVTWKAPSVSGEQGFDIDFPLRDG